MKNILKTIYPLVVITVFFGAVLGLTFKLLDPIIQKTRQKEKEAALKFVLSAADNFEENNLIEGATTNIYYKGYNSDKKLVGYVFIGKAIGYGGPVETLVGIDTNRTIEAIFILNADKETPGLGYKCTERKWQDQFSGLDESSIPRSKADYADNPKLDAITGATITSMAVARNLQIAYKLLEQVEPKVITNLSEGGMHE